MTTKDEALKLALEALEAADKHHNTTSLPQAIKNYGSRDAHAKAGFETWLTVVPHAITAIRAALASKSEALMSVPDGAQSRSDEEQQASQGPVAVYVSETWCGSVVRLYEDLPLETPLYTSPSYEATPLASQSRSDVKPWVSLTDDEVKHQWEIWRASIPRYVGFAKGIEAKLKEKNGF